ncbi:MAG: OmcA/MtrC family decaheme c-type cytochrome [Burkholderiales bacterium]|nr:OmcA/MtrC family decaheme c-type cytochrome [Burkholderiales bacterium]
MMVSRKLWGVAALVLAALAGCGGGSSGGTAAPTPTPTPTPPVAVPTGTSPITLTAATPAATFAALKLKVTVGRVQVSGAPVVDFSITDTDGNAIIGFGSKAQSSTAPVASYPNLAFSLAKLVPGANGSPSKWVSYIVSTVPTTTAAAAPTRPTSDNTGTLVDHQNGTYTYTFYRDVTQMASFVAAAKLTAPSVAADLGDLSYVASATHRLVMLVSGAAPGTGTNTPTATASATAAVNLATPVNVVYDFIPATGAVVASTDPERIIVSAASCNTCHDKLGGLVGTASAGFHGGNRYDPLVCVVCHTDQRKFGRSNVTSTNLAFPAGSATYVADRATVGDLPVLVHKLHMGDELAKQNYNFGGIALNETKFPQDVRNCATCHDGSAAAAHPTPQGNNWMNVPSATACGACHDGMNFATGTGVTLADAAKGLTVSTFGHIGGAQPNDSLCALCHTPQVIAIDHTPVTPPNPANVLLAGGTNANTNAAWLAGNTAHLPAGAIAVTYDLKSVSVNAASQPSLVFRMLQNGSPVAFNSPSVSKELWNNFVGSPSAYFVFSVPQDGIAAPADFNASASGYLRNIWNGTATGSGAGTLAGPDANGYYTVTLTGVKIPATAVMLTGGIGYTYGLPSTQPLTQTNLPAYPTAVSSVTPSLLTGGLVVVAPNVQMVATGYTGRRAIVDGNKCNACHVRLGLFTGSAFHAGQRNDGATCAWCHNPQRTSSGWSADSGYFVHALHGASARSQPFTWHAASTTDSFATIGYPGILSDCQTCHLAGTFDFSAANSAAAVPNRLYRTVATGTFNGTVTATNNALAVYSLSPYVVKDGVTSYGSGFAFNAATQVTTPASATSLVNSPITAVCLACHDNALATAHMSSNGGQIYQPRGTLGTPGIVGSGSGALGALSSGNGEACLVCHGSGKVADIAAVHPHP